MWNRKFHLPTSEVQIKKEKEKSNEEKKKTDTIRVPHLQTKNTKVHDKNV